MEKWSRERVIIACDECGDTGDHLAQISGSSQWRFLLAARGSEWAHLGEEGVGSSHVISSIRTHRRRRMTVGDSGPARDNIPGARSGDIGFADLSCVQSAERFHRHRHRHRHCRLDSTRLDGMCLYTPSAYLDTCVRVAVSPRYRTLHQSVTMTGSDGQVETRLPFPLYRSRDKADARSNRGVPCGYPFFPPSFLFLHLFLLDRAKGIFHFSCVFSLGYICLILFLAAIEFQSIGSAGKGFLPGADADGWMDGWMDGCCSSLLEFLLSFLRAFRSIAAASKSHDESQVQASDATRFSSVEPCRRNAFL